MADTGSNNPDQLQKINILLEEGNRSLSLNDYEASVAKLGEACQLLDSIHGELAPESGDAYFSYGRALLQHAIQQNTVLGDAKHQNTQEPSTAPAAAAPTAKPQAAASSKFHFEDDEPEQQGDEEEEQEEESQQEEGEDDEDDFETAWDILDLTRVIFEKNDDNETRLKLADVHLCLGDVSVETEKFDQALPDYRKALDIKKELLSPDDRQLAEAHYKLALALEFSTEEAEHAGQEIKNAIQVLQNRLQSIQGEQQNDTKGKGKAAAAVATTTDDTKEAKEIKELIADMEEKVDELTSRQEKQKEAEALLKSFLGTGGQSAAGTLNAAAVNDLSSMIKRKAAKSNLDTDQDSNKKQKQ